MPRLSIPTACAQNFDRASTFFTAHLRLVSGIGWVLVILWFALMLAVKIGLYEKGVVIGDVFMHANAIVNTDFHDHLLYVAGYEVDRGITTLLQDHFEPSSILLVPFYRLFDTPLFLIVLQGLGPVVLVAALYGVVRHFDGPPWLAPVMAVATLYYPQFVYGVIDSLGGYRHDAQFLIYAPVFLFCLLTNRPVLTVLSLLLFLGVKQNAAFSTATLGAALFLWRDAFGVRRSLAMTVAIISVIYFALSVFVIPPLIHSPNMYVASGTPFINAQMAGNAVWGCFHQKWSHLYLHFIYAFGALPFALSTVLDVSMYSLMGRQADSYYIFNGTIFLSVGTLLVLLRMRKTEADSLWGKARRPLIGLFALQMMVGIPLSLCEFGHIWRKSMEMAMEVPMATKEAAWQMTDKSCTVAPQYSLSDRFYRAPYMLLPWSADQARTVVSIDPSAMSAETRRRDLVLAFVEANASKLILVGRAGPLAVWTNPTASCLPQRLGAK